MIVFFSRLTKIFLHCCVTLRRCKIACVRFVRLEHSSLVRVFLRLPSSTVSGKLKALRRESLLDTMLCEYVSGKGTSSNTLSIIRHGSVSKSSKSDDDSILSSKWSIMERNVFITERRFSRIWSNDFSLFVHKFSDIYLYIFVWLILKKIFYQCFSLQKDASPHSGSLQSLRKRKIHSLDLVYTLSGCA